MKKIHIKIPQVKTRVTWGFNPITRVSKDKKAYSRTSYKNELRDKSFKKNTNTHSYK